jgi:translation initiation factor 2A
VPSSSGKKAKKGKQQEPEAPQQEAGAGAGTAAPAPVAAAGAEEEEEGGSAAKKLRALLKKLRGIDQLKQNRQQGLVLNEAQLLKLASETEVRAAAAAMEAELKAAGLR